VISVARRNDGKEVWERKQVDRKERKKRERQNKGGKEEGREKKLK
jgi:hypothetical protein